jgi:hypothetical protein
VVVKDTIQSSLVLQGICQRFVLMKVGQKWRHAWKVLFNVFVAHRLLLSQTSFGLVLRYRASTEQRRTTSLCSSHIPLICQNGLRSFERVVLEYLLTSPALENLRDCRPCVGRHLHGITPQPSFLTTYILRVSSSQLLDCVLKQFPQNTRVKRLRARNFSKCTPVA